MLLDQEVKRLEKAGSDSALRSAAKALLVVPGQVSRDLTHFTTDPRLLLEHRDRVARMIEQLRRQH